MSRTVYSKKDFDAQLAEIAKHASARERDVAFLEGPPSLEQKEPDKYTSRLLKYIPAEVVALYLTLDALIRTSEQLPISVYWVVFIVCLVLTYFYLRRVEKVDKNIQILISVVAYCVWVFAIGGPFVYLNWYHPIYGGLLLPTYTLVVAIIEA